MNIRVLAALSSLMLCCASIARSETLEWTRQLGTSSSELSYSVSADELGSVYISGYTEGSLGEVSAGGPDAFVSKYDASGALEWTRQLGTDSMELGLGVSADRLGNVYISGQTFGRLGETHAGGADAFVSKYDSSGTLEWTHQLGTSSFDSSWGVSADGLGHVYISGSTGGNLGGANSGEQLDTFVSKYDSSGAIEWTQQLGTSSKDYGQSVSADRLGSVYISGYTNGSLEGANADDWDAFISKYGASGTLEWTRQLGTSSSDSSYSVSADGLGGVYISGITQGNLEGTNAGGDDAFISKYGASGTLEWTRQLGTSSSDGSYGVSADGLGNVYMSGSTGGSLGEVNAGESDAFISKYDASGTLQWTQQLGTSKTDSSYGVSADGLGSVYISGRTDGSLEGPNAGDRDAFVAKFTDLPEPLLGDVNLDGVVNGLDVDAFVDAVLRDPFNPYADMNADGVVNGLDVDPFVAAVVGGTQQIPEPTTLLLALVALGVVGGWRKWGG